MNREKAKRFHYIDFCPGCHVMWTTQGDSACVGKSVDHPHSLPMSRHAALCFNAVVTGMSCSLTMNPLDPSPYGATDAQAHATTLSLLEEVADYLRRLPAHPMHRAMERKIQEHLDDPHGKAMKRRIAVLCEDEMLSARVAAGNGFDGVSRYTPSGLPVLSVRLLYPVLRLESPAVAKTREAGLENEAQKLATTLAQEIADGLEIKLSPLDPILHRRWIDLQGQ